MGQHNVAFTDKMWADLNFFAEELGFRTTTSLVHAAVLAYCREYLELINYKSEKEK